MYRYHISESFYPTGYIEALLQLQVEIVYIFSKNLKGLGDLKLSDKRI
jgi:hypothetical protein